MYSVVDGVYGGEQAGYYETGGQNHAMYWSGTSASALDLHSFLPANYTSSAAHGIWSNASGTYIAGEAVNGSFGRTESMLWFQAVPEPGPLLALGLGAVVLLRRRR